MGKIVYIKQNEIRQTINEIEKVVKLCETLNINTIQDLKYFKTALEYQERKNFRILLQKMQKQAGAK